MTNNTTAGPARRQGGAGQGRVGQVRAGGWSHQEIPRQGKGCLCPPASLRMPRSLGLGCLPSMAGGVAGLPRTITYGGLSPGVVAHAVRCVWGRPGGAGQGRGRVLGLLVRISPRQRSCALTTTSRRCCTEHTAPPPCTASRVPQQGADPCHAALNRRPPTRPPALPPSRLQTLSAARWTT